MLQKSNTKTQHAMSRNLLDLLLFRIKMDKICKNNSDINSLKSLSCTWTCVFIYSFVFVKEMKDLEMSMQN